MNKTKILSNCKYCKLFNYNNNKECLKVNLHHPHNILRVNKKNASSV